ncbi:MAG: Flp pilus assembly protein CpaB [Burkholderiales bacterium RIFCSPHIGHO2_01_FULL_63_240]|jgi:pilus assembly protein CpaB|nr:MAG: Flp pilus assembly protein CpaB [Burkholderiales bacterium RIFCSPHIGHO2_01_FULL_63_240]
MNNNVLKILAGVLALGAVIVALIGIRLSGAPSAPAATAASAPAPAASARFVVAARDIQAGRMLESADVQLETAASAPQGSLGSTQQAIGQVSSRDITKGTPVLLDAIAPESLSALLQPGERAVAVQVDEVIGVGGFARPGDFVDVLQFMGATRENQDTSFAQVLVRRARILTFGDATQIDQAAPTAQGQATQEAMRETGAQAALQARERRQSLRSAVLAVRESEASALMLAANTGLLRLALRPKHEGSEPPDLASGRLTTRVSDLSPMRAKPAATDAGSPIIIQEGSKERRLTRNDAPAQP